MHVRIIAIDIVLFTSICILFTQNRGLCDVTDCVLISVVLWWVDGGRIIIIIIII